MDGTTAAPSGNLTAVAGPLLIAFLINWALLGTLCVQVYTYYIAFPRDRKSTKILVYGLTAMELAQTVIATHDAFTVFARNFGDGAVLVGIHNSWVIVPLLGGSAGFAAQTFFSYRLLIISESRILISVIAFISLISFASAIVGAVSLQREHDLSSLDKKGLLIVIAIWPGLGAVCDALIAIFMTYYGLWISCMLTKLICVSMETGIVNASVASVCFILLISFPKKFYFIVPAVIISKVYANTILVALNNRLEIVNGRSEIQRDQETNTFSMAERNLGIGRVFGRIPLPLKRSPVVEMINIRKEVWTDVVDSEA